MVDMGLPEGMEWPSELHKKLAINLLICNPEISSMDLLQSGVINILNIPAEKIQNLLIEDLSKYGFEITTRIRPVTS